MVRRTVALFAGNLPMLHPFIVLCIGPMPRLLPVVKSESPGLPNGSSNLRDRSDFESFLYNRLRL